MYAHVEPIRDKYAMSDNELFRFSLIIFFHLGEGQFET